MLLAERAGVGEVVSSNGVSFTAFCTALNQLASKASSSWDLRPGFLPRSRAMRSGNSRRYGDLGEPTRYVIMSG
jgi:hypothetical protein